MSTLSRSNLFLAIVAVCAVGAALWYRQQVFRVPQVPEITPRLAFVTGGSGPYWQLTASGARAAEKEYRCEVEIKMPTEEENLEEQMGILTKLPYGQLDGVAVSPLDAEGQTKFINRVQQQTNVVTFDSDAPLSNRRGHVGTSNYGAGKMCAELVREALPEGGKILVLLANLTKENVIDRKSGFEEVLRKASVAANPINGGVAVGEDLGQTTEGEQVSEEGQDERAEEGQNDGEDRDVEEAPRLQYTVVAFLTDDGDKQQIERNISQTLAEHEDLACIVGMNAMHGPVIVETLEKHDRLGQIVVVAFDEEQGTLEGIEEGHIYATIAQDPYKYGYETIRMLSSLCRGGGSEVPIVGGGTVNINAEPIRKENLQEFRDRLKARIAASAGETQ